MNSEVFSRREPCICFIRQESSPFFEAIGAGFLGILCVVGMGNERILLTKKAHHTGDIITICPFAGSILS